MFVYFRIVVFVLLYILSNTNPSCNGKDEKEDDKPDVSLFVNPIFSPSFADPTFLRDNDGTFYVYSTEEDWNDGLGDKIIPIIKSKDLINWEYVGNVFSERPDFVKDGNHRWVWSPDAIKHDGKYFLFYSLSYGEDPKAGIGISWSDKPEGPFHDNGEFLRSDKIGVEHSIAPFFIEDNGKFYTFWGSFRGIYGIQQMGGFPKDKIQSYIKKGANLISVTTQTENDSVNILIHMLDENISIDDSLLIDGWTNYYREDDVSATAYFYMDKPSSNLPALDDVKIRTKNLIR